MIECKSSATNSQVSRDDLEQLTHSVDWFEDAYNPKTFTYTAVLIHPSRTPMWDAVPRQGARAMDFERLETFRDAIRAYVTAWCSDNSHADEAKVGASLRSSALSIAELEDRWTQKFRPSAKK